MSIKEQHAAELTHAWINDLDEWNNKRRAYRLLRSVLHALRDRLQLNEAADLGAQLPTLLRGIYCKQWQPSASCADPEPDSLPGAH